MLPCEEDDGGMDTATRHHADTASDPAGGATTEPTVDRDVTDQSTEIDSATDDVAGDAPLPPPPLDDVPPPPGGATLAPSVPETPPPPRPRRGAWHIVAIVVGAIMLLPGLGTLTGGIALVVANEVATDDGYFDGTLDRLESEGVAIATVDIWDEVAGDDDWPWVLDWLDLDIRLRVDGAADTDEVFVGIARTADVEEYLGSTRFSELVDIDDRAPTYIEQQGLLAIESPIDQGFWVENATGEGEQELTWEARGGRWSVVVMNADGSPDVAADVEVGLRSGAVTPIGVTLIVIGGLTALASIVLLVVGIRGRRP